MSNCILCTKEIDESELVVFDGDHYHKACLEDYNSALDELKSIYEEFEEDSK